MSVARKPNAAIISLTVASLFFIGAVHAQQARPAAQPQARPAAQQPAAQQQLTPEQQAALTRQNQEMTKGALTVLQMIDGNQPGAVWDGASAVMKRAVTRDAFVKQVAADRQRLGAVANRGQSNVSRAQYPAGADVPQGLYLNVAIPTKFANNPQPIRELVSFRLDEDKTWRVSGYSIR